MKIGRIFCTCLLLMGLLALFPSSLVLAQDEIEEEIELEPTFRKLEATAPGASFEFEVGLKYFGSETREFDLTASGPAARAQGRDGRAHGRLGSGPRPGPPATALAPPPPVP